MSYAAVHGADSAPDAGSASPATAPWHNPLFDHEYYAATYGLSLTGVDLSNHYAFSGRFKGFDPNRYFDTAWYIAQNKDVRDYQVNPLDHYLERGADEGRSPSPAFDGRIYYLLYPDVQKAGMNPLLHFLQHGRREGRFAPPGFLLPACAAMSNPAAVAKVDRELVSAVLPLIRQLSDWTATLLDHGGSGSGPGLTDARACPPRTTLVALAGSSPEATCATPANAVAAPVAAGCDKVGRAARTRSPSSARMPTSPVLAKRSPFLVRLFAWLFARDLAASFEAVRVLGALPAPVDGPVIMLTNHPSWWDAELYHWFAATIFPDRRGFAPMTSADLARHAFLARLGAFPVHLGTLAGAAAFLATAEQILQERDAVLSIAVEGCFRDARERPIRPMPGVAVLARRVPNVTVIPVAIDYVFWSERRPNLLLRFGEPIAASSLAHLSAAAITSRFAEALETAMGALAEAGQSRKAERFQTLLKGRVGHNLIHDLWCVARARVRGSHHDAELRPMLETIGAQRRR